MRLKKTGGTGIPPVKLDLHQQIRCLSDYTTPFLLNKQNPEHRLKKQSVLRVYWAAAGVEHIELFQPGTACFAQNDMMALGALEALREQGIQVPDDVALIGSDNIPMGSWFTPHLTTVAVDYDKIINLTVEWVMAMASNKLPDTYRYILDSKLIIRDTFCPSAGE